jgi:hypothetical protein
MTDPLPLAILVLEHSILAAEQRFTVHVARLASSRQSPMSKEMTKILQQNLAAYWVRRRQLLRLQETTEAASRALARGPHGTPAARSAGLLVEQRTTALVTAPPASTHVASRHSRAHRRSPGAGAG